MIMQPTTGTLIAQAASAGKFWRQPAFFISFALAVACNIITYLALWTGIPQTTDLVILHYNIYYGADLLNHWPQLLYVPASGSGLILINTSVSIWLVRRDIFLARTVMFTTVLLQIVLLTAAALLVAVN